MLCRLPTRNLDEKHCLEQVVPELVRPVQRQIGQECLGVVGRSLVDVLVIFAFARGSNFPAARSHWDARTSRHTGFAKLTRHPANTLVPFAIQTGGRLGVDAYALHNQMTNAAENPAAQRLLLYLSVSRVLQDGVARALLRAKMAA